MGGRAVKSTLTPEAKRVYEIALKVRRRLSAGQSPVDHCDLWSAILWQQLAAEGHAVRLISGHVHVLDPEDLLGHIWIETPLNGVPWVIDISADQFNGQGLPDYPTVLVVPASAASHHVRGHVMTRSLGMAILREAREYGL